MHEMHTAQNILKILKDYAKKEDIKKVSKVGVELGFFSCLMPSSLSFYFDIARRGTIAEGAVIDIKKRHITGLCNECCKEFETAELLTECPNCKSNNIKTKEDDTLNVLYIEGE